ncbi:accessory gene regulator B family protein [Solibacillus sp. FSL K6-1126]|uniref:accessory gene regulator B family protein n=1 Tax=Solibacillus sp. FSL K6-1126 TaxID=2921463 RepID=UPI004046B022
MSYIIEELSYKLSKKICCPIDRINDIEIVQYGIEVIIKGLIKVFTLVLIGLLLSNLSLLMCTSLAFILFRLVSGGFHFQSYMACFLFSMGILSTLSLLAETLSTYLLNWTLILPSFSVISFVILLVYRPLINQNRPFAEKNFIYLLLSIFYLTICILTSLILIRDSLEYAIAIQLSLLVQSITLISKKKVN